MNTDGHPSYDELAELDADALSGARTGELRAHLADCRQCQDRSAAITGVRRDLAALGPAEMPRAVAERLTTVLAEQPAVTDDRATILPLSPSRRRLGTPTLATAAASFILVAAVAAVLVGHNRSHHPTNTSTSSESAGSATLPPLPHIPAGTLRIHTSGTNYTPATLTGAVPGLVGSSAAASALPTPSASAADGRGAKGAAPQRSAIGAAAVPAPLRPLYRSRTTLLRCAVSVSPTGATPIAVDFARWTNQQYAQSPSVVFVYRETLSTATVVVTGPTCAGVDQDREYIQGVPLS